MPHFWLDAFTPESWEESRANGFRVSGFHRSRYATVQRFREGDILLCWVVGLQKIIGAVRVAGEPYLANQPQIWSDGLYSARVAVEPIIALTIDKGCDLREPMKKLSFYDARNMHKTWSHFRGSPNELADADGQLLLDVLEACQIAALDGMQMATPP